MTIIDFSGRLLHSFAPWGDFASYIEQLYLGHSKLVRIQVVTGIFVSDFKLYFFVCCYFEMEFVLNKCLSLYF